MVARPGGQGGGAARGRHRAASSRVGCHTGEPIDRPVIPEAEPQARLQRNWRAKLSEARATSVPSPLRGGWHVVPRACPRRDVPGGGPREGRTPDGPPPLAPPRKGEGNAARLWWGSRFIRCGSGKPVANYPGPREASRTSRDPGRRMRAKGEQCSEPGPCEGRLVARGRRSRRCALARAEKVQAARARDSAPAGKATRRWPRSCARTCRGGNDSCAPCWPRGRARS